MLDIAGLSPGIGNVPDLLNAVIYVAEGDLANATQSAISAIPLVGIFSTTTKIVKTNVKSKKVVKGVGGAKVYNFIKNNVNPTFQKNVKKAFTSDAKVSVLTEDKIVYRYHGGDSSGKSYWYTPKKTTNPEADLALPKGNTYTQVDILVIPKGTEVLEGTVAPNFGQRGGGCQIYVPDPSVVRKH